MDASINTTLRSRLDFVGLDAAALEDIAAHAPQIAPHLDTAVAACHDRLAGEAALARRFGSDGLAAFRDRQAAHLSAVAQGRIDGDFQASCQAIGKANKETGLDPKWMFGCQAVIADILIEAMIADFFAKQAKKPAFGLKRAGRNAESVEAFSACLRTLVKALFLDLDLTVTGQYAEAKAESDDLNARIAAVAEAAKVGDFSLRLNCKSNDLVIEGLAEAVDDLMATVNAAIDDTDEVLQALANADLTKRVEGTHYGVFEDLQINTNSVSDRLTEIMTRLRQTSRGVKSATGEILTGANDLSERTTKQAATIEETSAAMEQLATTVMESARRAGAASEQAELASHTAEEGGEVMHKANDAMERISTSSAKISNIIGMIDDIAFQTNLLALNASVEAARAGEAGKGFAVVAVEVRRLAQSAAEASADVKTLIEQSGQEVAGGTRLVAEAAEKLSSMLEAVRTNAAQMAEIAKDSGEQASAIEEVNVAVRQMDEMTQHNAALVEQTNAAIEQTENQASELDRIVEVFTLADGGAPVRQAAPVANKASPDAVPRSPAAKAYLNQGNVAVDQNWSEF